MLKPRASLVVAVYLCAAVLRGSSAEEKSDLKRITPVPAGEQIPIMDFFRPRTMREPKLNPSGTHIAAITTVGEDRHQLFVYELKSRKGELIGGPGDKDIYEIHWLNDRRLLFQLSGQKLWGLGLFAANVGAIRDAYPLFQYWNSSVIAVPSGNRLRPLVWNRHDSIDTGKDLGVVEVNTDLHEGSFIDLVSAGASDKRALDAQSDNANHITVHYPAPEAGMAVGYLADKEGRLEFAFTEKGGDFSLHQLVAQKWKPCAVNLGEIYVIGCGEQSGQLVVLGPPQQGKPRAVQFMDGATGRLGEVLLQDDAYDFDGWLYRDVVTHDIVGAVFDRAGLQVVWFNESYHQLQKKLESIFPGLLVRIINNNEAKTIFLVATSSDRQPSTYSWVDLEKGSVAVIKSSAPWIDPQRMQPMNAIKFKTRDGRQLDAYLTLPAGASKANPPPLVVLPHGGPWVRDTWGFDGEAQFLASRGYAVMQPNYRGSTGYGWMFPEEDEWDFRKMHDDVTDATKTMIASGLIDRNRIAIMGGSFGGYLAVSGVVNEPELYRCAVSIAGVFDWEQQIKSKKYDRYDSPVFDRMMRKLGDPKLQQEKFDAISPLRHVEQIRVPVFVSGGKEDQIVEIQQSKRLISELEKNHVPFEKFLVSDEGHGMGHLKNEVELYSRIEAFLEKYLKPVKPGA